MHSLNAEELKNLNSDHKKIVLFGAGMIGKLIYYHLKNLNIKVDYFFDSDLRISEKKIQDCVIKSPEHLKLLDSNTAIILTNSYFEDIFPMLKEKKFFNIFSCDQIFKDIDFDQAYNDNIFDDERDIYPKEKIIRHTNYYTDMYRKEDYLKNNFLYVKSIDIQVTEKCSASCDNCSNLMHLYSNAKDSEIENIISSIDRFMKVVDQVDEFRVIGGDPFMNKQMHKVVNKLCLIDKAKKVVVYTNAKIIPKNENLKCLKNSKVVVDVSNYANEASKNHEKIIELFSAENINFTTNKITKWQDCGRILPKTNKNHTELNKLFINCCNSELISLLHGKVYRCPFSANATNLNLIPDDTSDYVNLLDENSTDKNLRDTIFKLMHEKNYLTACSFCNGRDYSTKWIKAAVQIERKPKTKVIINAETAVAK